MTGSQVPMIRPKIVNAKKLDMPTSEARITFVANSADMRSYLALHQHVLKGLGKRIGNHHIYVLDKAVYVLVASLWEAYCEDIVTECLAYVAMYAPSYKSLPQTLVNEIEKNMRSGKDSPWDLAGEGWRDYIKKRRAGYEKKRNKDFAGPKSEPVEEFFYNVLGIEKLRDTWKNVGYPEVCDELDNHLDRRNSLVHRITPGRTVNKTDVKMFYKLVWSLVLYTDRVVDDTITQVTGKSRWQGGVDVGDSGISSI
jgi:hypothetical protein